MAIKEHYPYNSETGEVKIPLGDYLDLRKAHRDQQDRLKNQTVEVTKELYERMDAAMIRQKDNGVYIKSLCASLDALHKLQDRQMAEIADLTKQNRELTDRIKNSQDLNAALSLDLVDCKKLLEFWKAPDLDDLSRKLTREKRWSAHLYQQCADFKKEDTRLRAGLSMSEDYIKALEQARDERAKDHFLAIDRLVKENGRLLKYKRNYDKLMALFNNLQICHGCLVRGKRAIIDLDLDNELEIIDDGSYSFGEAGKPLC